MSMSKVRVNTKRMSYLSFVLCKTEAARMARRKEWNKKLLETLIISFPNSVVIESVVQ